MSDLFEFKFICKGCGTHPAKVRYRNEGEDIMSWLHDVRQAVRAVHPMACTTPSCDLWIPHADDDDWPIGQKRTMN